MDLFSVFMTPPIFRVLHGRQEIGQVDESALLAKHDGPRVLSLGGKAWTVNFIDWQRKIAFVEPTDELGRTRWPGSGLGRHPSRPRARCAFRPGSTGHGPGRESESDLAAIPAPPGRALK
ncbi:MAG: hypothetical protein ACK56I_37320, partial [bacterium]